MSVIDREGHLLKCFLLSMVAEFNIVKPVLLECYVRVIRDDENTVRLPLLFRLGLSHQHEDSPFLSLVHHHLDYLLLYDTEETHFYLLNLMALLFSHHKNNTQLFVAARQRLVDAALHFEYADVLWLYAARLMNPQRLPVKICTPNRPETTNLLLRYLYTQTSSLITIKTVVHVYELRATTLFRSVVALLIKEKRHEEAADVCLFMEEELGVLQPLFYLKGFVPEAI